MSDSVFTKIIYGEIPCHKVYEDEHTFAFMDIHPVQPGMVLVVTKNPIDYFENLPEQDLITLMITVHKLSNGLKKVFPSKKRIGVQVEGFEVPHVHVKLIPINSGLELRAKPPSNEPNHDELAELASKIRGKIDE